MTEDAEYFYWDKGAVAPLSQYFGTKEFTCHCTHPECIKHRVAKDLLFRLGKIRDTLGKPLLVHSGFRCSDYQNDLRMQGYETAKGVSQHELGRAADVACDVMGELLSLCNQNFKAVGAARSFIHVDLRDDAIRRWSYQTM